jgi:ABC-type transport system substrate-binding protein
MALNYWHSILATRLSRRRALQITGMTSAGAAFLAACGGDDGKPSSSSDLVAQPKDSFAQAATGGTMKLYVTAEPQTLDPATPVAPLNFISGYVYGTLLNEKPGHLEQPQFELYGDIAESWETSPDRLQITLKIKPSVKWHNKPPVNGRTVDVDDVLFSWDRYTKLSPVSSLSYNGKNPNAPVLSVAATDRNTVTIKLQEPLSYALNYFAAYGSHTGNMIMMPKETGTGFDPRNQMIGHGPYELASATPSVAYSVKRFPDYYDAKNYAIEQIDLPIVTEYSARLAQFKTGNTHRLIGEAALAQDLVVTKRDEPRLEVQQTDFAANANIIVFGQHPEGKSPFLDERVRQAFSMGIDRDAWISASYNVSDLEASGLPVETRWNSHLLANWNEPDYWLDPRGKDFGENAKYFNFDLQEGKKLLAAAGYPNGFNVTSSYSVERLNFAPTAEPIDGMLRELGLNIRVNTPNYANDYIPNYRDGHGQYEGYAYATVLGTLPQNIHPAASLVAEYWPSGGDAFRGFSAGGTNDQKGDPRLNDMLEKARLEFDEKALKSQLHDIQRYLARTMWGLNTPGGATSFRMNWPAVRNSGVWRRTRQGGFSQWDPYQLWLDQSQPPFTS